MGCLILAEGDRLVLLVRAKEPSAGRLALPGGFVDPGEGALDALRRECREEIGWDPGGRPEFLASFPNRYEYRGFVYNTCDLFFLLRAPELRPSALRCDPAEARELRFLRPEDVDPAELAFDSTRRAVGALREYLTK